MRPYQTTIPLKPAGIVIALPSDKIPGLVENGRTQGVAALLDVTVAYAKPGASEVFRATIGIERRMTPQERVDTLVPEALSANERFLFEKQLRTARGPELVGVEARLAERLAVKTATRIDYIASLVVTHAERAFNGSRKDGIGEIVGDGDVLHIPFRVAGAKDGSVSVSVATVHHAITG